MIFLLKKVINHFGHLSWTLMINTPLDREICHIRKEEKDCKIKIYNPNVH